ncbi:MAG: RrF2 family transcriptional regulator [Oscillospiraceae bacterium]
MKISTKGRYALRLLIDLAQHPNDGYISLKEIAERQSLSKKYLEQIVPMLTKSDLLKTNRGYQGGYLLTKKPELYTVGEIMKVSEGSLFVEEYTSNSPDSAEDLTIPVWEGLNKAISDYLYGVTLQDIIDSASKGDDYCI